MAKKVKKTIIKVFWMKMKEFPQSPESLWGAYVYVAGNTSLLFCNTNEKEFFERYNAIKLEKK